MRDKIEEKLLLIGSDNGLDKKVGKVGYWATSISTIRTTVLSEKVIKTDSFPDLDISFRILDMTTSRCDRS